MPLKRYVPRGGIVLRKVHRCLSRVSASQKGAEMLNIWNKVEA